MAINKDFLDVLPQHIKKGFKEYREYQEELSAYKREGISQREYGQMLAESRTSLLDYMEQREKEFEEIYKNRPKKRGVR